MTEKKAAQKTIAILAGSGPAPSKAVTSARRAGHKVVAITISESGGRLCRQADVSLFASLLKGAEIIAALEKHKCEGVLFAGKFDKRMHGLDLSQIDEVSGAMLMRLPGRADMQIAQVVLEELEDRGFPPVDQRVAFAQNVAAKGVLAGSAPQLEKQRDIDLGIEVARAVAGFDIGQTVAVCNGLVVAVEGAEHSDGCITRAGRLSAGPTTIVKVARPNQDFRFDTPVVGNQTLRTMNKAHADLLVIEAGRTLIMDDTFFDLAHRLDIAVIGV